MVKCFASDHKGRDAASYSSPRRILGRRPCVPQAWSALRVTLKIRCGPGLRTSAERGPYLGNPSQLGTLWLALLPGGRKLSAS